MMQMILEYYDAAQKALDAGANINKLVDIPVRERIGRYKYTPEADLDSVYKDIIDDLNAQIDQVIKEKEDF